MAQGRTLAPLLCQGAGEDPGLWDGEDPWRRGGPCQCERVCVRACQCERAGVGACQCERACVPVSASGRVCLSVRAGVCACQCRTAGGGLGARTGRWVLGVFF
jgi:hypothetical protein